MTGFDKLIERTNRLTEIMKKPDMCIICETKEKPLCFICNLEID